MPLATRITDVCTGHGCYGSRPSCSGSPNVITNNLNQMRVTDCYESHCCGIPCHGGMLAQGSATVFVNNLQAGRTGDPVDCGSCAQAHSPDVDIGG